MTGRRAILALLYAAIVAVALLPWRAAGTATPQPTPTPQPVPPQPCAVWAAVDGVARWVAQPADFCGLAASTPTPMSAPPAPTPTATPLPPSPTAPAPTASVTPAPPTPTATPPGGYGALLFADEFGGATVDGSRWAFAFPWGAKTNRGAPEQQCFEPSALSQHDGWLDIATTHQPGYQCVDSGGALSRDWVSGAIFSYPSLNANCVYAEARARLTRAKGYWPGFWAAASDRGWPPEVDGMEIGGTGSSQLGAADGLANDHYTSTYHAYDQSAPEHQLNPGVDLTDWHTYGMWWCNSGVIFYFDGAEHFRTTYQPPTESMYAIFSVSVSATATGSPDATTPEVGHTLVDWIRVWSAHP